MIKPLERTGVWYPQVSSNKWKRKFKKNLVFLLMVAPTVIYFFIFSYIPMAGVYMAFTDYSFTGGIFGSKFIGLANYDALIITGDLLRITMNTLLYNLVFIFLSNLTAMFVAILFSELTGKFFKKVTQSLIFLPHFISFVIVGAFIYNTFNYEAGTLNTLLKTLHYEPVDVYSNEYIWPFILVFFNLWKSLGFYTLMYFAAIMGINTEYYEAAKMDGASIFAEIRYITLPLLKPTFIILVLLSLGSIMKGQFDLFYNIVGIAPINILRITDIIDTYVFRMATQGVNYSSAAAVGLYQSLIGFITIIVVNKLVKIRDPERSLF